MVFNQPKWGIWSLKSPWRFGFQRNYGEFPTPRGGWVRKLMAFVQKGIIAPRYEGTVSWVSWRLWVSIFPIRGQWSFPTTSYIYIYHEWTGIISPRHGKANDAWGEVPPKSIDFRLANEYNAARLHSTMWILISPTCGYGPAIQYPMISLLVVPFGPSNLSISSPWEAGGCEWTVVWEDMGMPLYLATLLVDCHNPGTPCYYNWSSFSLKPIHSYLFGGVPEIWVPQTMVFLIDNNHFGMFWGTHISGNPSINKPSINHP